MNAENLAIRLRDMIGRFRRALRGCDRPTEMSEALLMARHAALHGDLVAP